jgi:hypothetical protein
MANSLFFIGSIMWIVSACVCDEAATPATTGARVEATALLATSCFFVDAMCVLCCLVGDETNGPRESLWQLADGAAAVVVGNGHCSSVDYLFWGNVMFFVGTGLDFHDVVLLLFIVASLDAPHLAGIDLRALHAPLDGLCRNGNCSCHVEFDQSSRVRLRYAHFVPRQQFAGEIARIGISDQRSTPQCFHGI